MDCSAEVNIGGVKKRKGDNVRTLLGSVSSCELVGGQELSILGEAAELVWDAWGELVSLQTC